MKVTAALVMGLLVLTILGSGIALAQGPGMPPPPGVLNAGQMRIMIGTMDRGGPPREVRGKITIMSRAPSNVQAAAVQFFADDKPIGSGTSRKTMYTLDYDTTGIKDGEHVLKAVAKDTAGKDAWTGSTKVIVANSKPAGGSPGAKPTLTVPPPPSNGVPKPVSPDATQPSAEPGKPAVTPANPTEGANGAASGKEPLFGVLKSERYGFSMNYPSKWTTRDETAKIKPQVAGSWWVVMGVTPVDSAPIVVNVRRRQLEPGTDANTFAKYEDYVQKWERKAVQGSVAFANTSGTPETKRVVHRMIIVRDGVAWMLNCTDTSGKPAAQSAKLFESMVDSIQFSPVVGGK